MKKGYVHVYTGNGKGKTTAALGLSLRAICAGKKVFFGQFVKGMDYSELKAVEYLPHFTIQQFGRDCFIFHDPTEKDIEIAKDALKKMGEILAKGEYDLVVMDEVNIALYYHLFSVEDVLKIIDGRAEHVEVVCTGRNAPQELIDRADLVTEMKEIKHYYTQGVQAREGIEK
ncbi:cob(I)yrinic acid a,c-diamide adenosyltransferase [Garciella nitratireducens]|uniref:Cob(I)alamin adenosyltransferase n=1 Tax=Garciella nitratireducens DSM 15102 TaxID=1121911 RepID=A0A1T4KN64_9FIRM|nr:cob(I)yrinic acid a,c-diamide adenosyltransferase [Garciella nitratireducens]RBP40284.1 cob(I)yrinic acid a,c-diamide adenosyltransferase [Garciella nitratireducens]SJZ43846.1 cob(I)alamin adenosyltransferase [Garciella nitratireducens DSM 15102]